MKDLNGPIGNRVRDLGACSVVLTVLLRAPHSCRTTCIIYIFLAQSVEFTCLTHSCIFSTILLHVTHCWQRTWIKYVFLIES